MTATTNHVKAVELDDRFSEEAKMLARLAPKASMEAVRDAWARGLSVNRSRRHADIRQGG